MLATQSCALALQGSVHKPVACFHCDQSQQSSNSIPLSIHGQRLGCEQVFWYNSSDGQGHEASGAYIFRPNGSIGITAPIPIEIVEGPVLTEIRQVCDKFPNTSTLSCNALGLPILSENAECTHFIGRMMWWLLGVRQAAAHCICDLIESVVGV